jgi:hypothetical protein
MPSMLWVTYCAGVCWALGKRCELLSVNCWRSFNFIFISNRRMITWISTKGWRSRMR